jgi:putative sigma-54 modulation protein
MQVAVTFRHMDVSEPLRAYVEEKIARVKKYIEEPIDADVTLSVEKKIRHKADVALVAKGLNIKGSEETNDMYAAIDAVVDKIERQLKRYK